jgi:hypothetical protein
MAADAKWLADKGGALRVKKAAFIRIPTNRKKGLYLSIEKPNGSKLIPGVARNVGSDLPFTREAQARV